MDAKIQDKLENVFNQFKQQKYKKGEILIRADDAPSGVFYLKEGFVKMYAISKKGDELVVNIFKPLSFFPLSWALNNSQNNYYYEALSSVSVWRAPKEEVVAFLKREPDVLFDLLSRVYKGTDGLLTKMTYLMAGNAYARLIEELIIHAKRFGKKQGTVVTMRVCEKDLAAQTGMTRETVSREIKLLKEKGLVYFTNNILTIADLQSLEDEVLGGV